MAGDKSICQIQHKSSSYDRLIIGLVSESAVELAKQNSGNTFDLIHKSKSNSPSYVGSGDPAGRNPNWHKTAADRGWPSLSALLTIAIGQR